MKIGDVGNFKLVMNLGFWLSDLDDGEIFGMLLTIMADSVTNISKLLPICFVV